MADSPIGVPIYVHRGSIHKHTVQCQTSCAHLATNTSYFTNCKTNKMKSTSEDCQETKILAYSSEICACQSLQQPL